MWIPKYWKNTNDVSKKRRPLSVWTLQTTNLHKLRFARDLRRCGRILKIFMRWKYCLTLSSFVANFSHARYKRVMICCITSTCQGAWGSNSLFGCTRERRKHCYDLVCELTNIVRIFDQCLEDVADDFFYDSLHDNTFVGWFVKVQKEGTSIWGCPHSVAT